MRVVFFFLLLSSASAQVLVNGSFEAPGLSHTMNVSGVFSFSGWSGVASSDGGNAGLVVGTDNGLAPSAGNQHFTFNGGNPSDRGYIEQSFSTVTGQSYAVSFAVGRSGGGQELSLLASVSSGGSTLGSLAASPPGDRSYGVAGFSFVATGASSTLRFADTSGGNSISDLYLDNVSVSASAIPEPGAWAVWAGGAGLILAVVWRRRGVAREQRSLQVREVVVSG